MVKMVKVDEKKCIGCGLCAIVCSDVFEMGSDGKTHVKNAKLCKNGKCREAANSCPVQAITVK